MEPNELDGIKAQLERIEREVSAVRARVQAMEAKRLEDAWPEAAWTEVERPVKGPLTPLPPAAAPAKTSAQPPIPPIPPMPPRGKPTPDLGAARPAAIPAVRALVPREPSAAQVFLQNAWRQYGPPSDLSWEMALGTWWLPRIGSGVLCIAMVWLLTMFMGQLPEAWWPYLRLGIGAAVCLGLLGIGRWLEGRHADYARVLMSGGIAMSYLVVFATHYVEYTQIVFTPHPTLMLLAALTALWFSAAAIRRSWLLAMFVTAAGHATVALSTLSLPVPHPTAIMGLLALAAGTAAFLPREGWRMVAFAGLLGSYGNYFLWLANSPGSDALSAFVTAMAVLAAFFAMYLAADFFQPEAQRARFRPRSLYASFNTAGLAVLGYALVSVFPFANPIVRIPYLIDIPYTAVFFLLAAAALAAMAAAYAYLRDGDRIYDIFIAKASLLTAFGLLETFDGRTLTVALALEALVLMALSLRQGLASTRLLALAAAAVAAAHGALEVPLAWEPDAALTVVPAAYFIRTAPTLLALAAFAAMAALYAKANWQRHAGPPVPATLWWQPFAEALEWVRTGDGAAPSARPFIAAALAVAGAVVLCLHVTVLVPPGWEGLLLITTGLLLAAGAAVAALPAWSIAALLLGGAGAGWIFNLMQQRTPLEAIAISIAALLAISIASERRYFGRLAGLSPFQARGIGLTAYGIVAALAFLAAFQYHPFDLPGPVWVVAGAVIAALLTLVLHRPAWASVAAVYFVAGGITWTVYLVQRGHEHVLESTWWEPLAIAIAIAGPLGERFFARYPGEKSAQIAGNAGIAVAGLVLFQAMTVWIEPPWQALPHAALALGLLAWAGAFRVPVAAAVGVLLASFTTSTLLTRSIGGELETVPMLASFAGVIGFWVIVERAASLWKPEPLAATPWREPLTGSLAALASALLIGMLYWLPAIPNNYTSIAWTLAAFSLFGVSLALRQKYYRYAGLGLIFIVLARVFLVDTAQLEPVYRIAAGGLLGIVMCAVGYGYVRARQGGE